jgi:hypothetical protein
LFVLSKIAFYLRKKEKISGMRMRRGFEFLEAKKLPSPGGFLQIHPETMSPPSLCPKYHRKGSPKPPEKIIPGSALQRFSYDFILS